MSDYSLLNPHMYVRQVKRTSSCSNLPAPPKVSPVTYAGPCLRQGWEMTEFSARLGMKMTEKPPELGLLKIVNTLFAMY